MLNCDIVEDGIYAYSIMFFSVEVLTNLTLIEIEKAEEKAMMRAGMYICVGEV